MFLIVGLGNPGSEYVKTRHNVGFEVIDYLAEQYRFEPFRVWKRAEVCRGKIASTDAMLVKPQTFMNRSGEAGGAILHFYKCSPAEVVVVHDELDFAPGYVRLKDGGGHGGHNGLRSLTEHIGADYARIRLGIGKPPSATHGANYVLARFDNASRQKIDGAIEEAAQAVAAIVLDGVTRAMNQINSRKPK